MESFQESKYRQKIKSEIDFIKEHLDACRGGGHLSGPRLLLMQNYKSMIESRREVLMNMKH